MTKRPDPTPEVKPFTKAECILFLTALLWATATSAFSATEIKAAVASSNSIATLSDRELTSILTLQKRQWENGERIVIILPPISHPSFSEFIIEHTGFYPYQLKRRWDRTRFSGRGRAPITANTQQETLDLLKQNPSALVFLPADLNSTEVKYVTLNE